MAITVTVDTKELAKAVLKMQAFSQRRMAATVATAITRTAKEARDEVRKELPRAIDRPSPYTSRGLFMRAASVAKPEARVWYGDEPVGNQTPQSRYLYPQIHGGPRRMKRFELALQAAGNMPKGWMAVPSKYARLDAYGNVARGQLQQIISQVGTELATGYNRTLRRRPGESAEAFKRRKAAAQGRAGGQFVAITEARGKLAPGIYQATGRSFGRLGFGRSGALVPILFFVPSVKYSPRFRFYEVAQATVAKAFPAQLDRAIRESAARMAASGTQQSFGGF